MGVGEVGCGGGVGVGWGGVWVRWGGGRGGGGVCFAACVGALYGSNTLASGVKMRQFHTYTPLKKNYPPVV